MGIKYKIRSVIKKIYYKLNPQYKFIIWTHDRVNQIFDRVVELNQRIDNKQIFASTANPFERDALFLATDIATYRYLYLLRYIRESDSVLDVEAEYGTGMDLLYRYTPMDRGVCLNSIDYYTRLGGMYYGSESVKYQTGTVHDVKEKYDVITVLKEQRASRLGDEDWRCIYDLLEPGGILAVAFTEDAGTEKPKDAYFRDIGFVVEKLLYQNLGFPELCEQRRENTVTVLYLRKSNERHGI